MSGSGCWPGSLETVRKRVANGLPFNFRVLPCCIARLAMHLTTLTPLTQLNKTHVQRHIHRPRGRASTTIPRPRACAHAHPTPKGVHPRPSHAQGRAPTPIKPPHHPTPHTYAQGLACTTDKKLEHNFSLHNLNFEIMLKCKINKMLKPEVKRAFFSDFTSLQTNTGKIRNAQ